MDGTTFVLAAAVTKVSKGGDMNAESSSSPQTGRTPAQRLLGTALTNGWNVVAEVPKPTGATGGHFSHGYIVEKAGKKGFLKALDYSAALSATDPAQELQRLTAAYLFERDLVNRCRENRLSRIVMPLDDGSISIDPMNPAGTVQFLIFELGDGDIRHHIQLAEELDLTWTLQCLHHIAVGLMQLHGIGIAHQDLKPSNVMIFQKLESKLADLGRAAAKGQTPPHDDIEVAGDYAYAPPELLYGACPTDWNQRRFGCDAYLLGSMIVFFFTGTTMTGLLFSMLNSTFDWSTWGGTYGEILPYLQESFSRALAVIRESIPKDVQEQVTVMIQQLCNPDPARRGHPKNHAARGNPYSLERYVTQLDVLRQRVEYQRIKLPLRTS